MLMSNKVLEKRIDNAMTALEFCRDSKSEWGIQYWSNVLGVLLRKMRRSVDFVS